MKGLENFPKFRVLCGCLTKPTDVPSRYTRFVNVPLPASQHIYIQSVGVPGVLPNIYYTCWVLTLHKGLVLVRIVVPIPPGIVARACRTDGIFGYEYERHTKNAEVLGMDMNVVHILPWFL